MLRVFVNQNDIEDNKARITGDDVKHITKVLRLNEGERITLCDGLGNDYSAIITDCKKDAVLCDIIGQAPSVSEPNVKVTLFQGFPKSDKMEYIIQKCCELGVSEIVPVLTDRCVVKLKDDSENKINRLNKVSESAAKQSGRGIIPKVLAPVSFNTAITMLKEFDLPIMPYELEDSVRIKDGLKTACKPNRVGILIGPEGGFSDREADHAKAAGIITVSLGKRILRTETAGAVALALVMYELGEM